MIKVFSVKVPFFTVEVVEVRRLILCKFALSQSVWRYTQLQKHLAFILRMNECLDIRDYIGHESRYTILIMTLTMTLIMILTNNDIDSKAYSHDNNNND